MVSFTALSLSVTIFIFLLNFSSAKKVCLSPANKKVDWYVLLLFPIKGDKEGNLKYAYFDNYSTSLTIHDFNEKEFPVLKLLDDINSRENYFFWNDDMTSESGAKSSGQGKAHSKGGLIFDKKEGVFLSHSLPRFPWRTENNDLSDSLPPNTGIYGQNFLCLSIDSANSMNVIETLNIINPALVKNVESDNVFSPPNDFIEKLIKNRQDSSLQNTKIVEIETKGKNKFNIFSKSKNEEDLPWDTLIPNFYKDGLYVETWTKPDLIESYCANKRKKILNVMKLKFGDIEYDQNQEHSKWAVGINKNFVCFGDLNRTGSQKSRGGNTVCFENDNLANILRSGIEEYESCPLKFLLE